MNKQFLLRHDEREKIKNIINASVKDTRYDILLTAIYEHESHVTLKLTDEEVKTLIQCDYKVTKINNRKTMYLVSW